MNAPASINGPTVPAVIEQPGQAKAPLVAGARPKAIVPADMDQVWRFAQIVAKSGLAPRDMQKPETITVAIMHGLEVGLTPLMALQRIAVINGRPSIWGDGAMGLVRASGLCEFVYENLTGEGENAAAICRVKRKGEKEPIERSFSVADAKRAGLWGKQGPWQQYPKRMLQMRARAFALRDLFADVLGGLYIAEELEGLEEPAVKEINPRPVVKGETRPELPPTLPARASSAPHAEPAYVGDAPVAPPPGRKPLPPVANAKKAEPTDETQRNAPPADQPEAFREFVIAKLNTAKAIEDVQVIWDSYVQPNIDANQIMPPDRDDIDQLFAAKRTEIYNS